MKLREATAWFIVLVMVGLSSVVIYGDVTKSRYDGLQRAHIFDSSNQNATIKIVCRGYSNRTLDPSIGPRIGDIGITECRAIAP